MQIDEGLVCALWPFQWLLIYRQCCDAGMGGINQTRWPNGKGYFEQSAKLESIFTVIQGEYANYLERNKHGN